MHEIQREALNEKNMHSKSQGRENLTAEKKEFVSRSTEKTKSKNENIKCKSEIIKSKNEIIK